MRTGPRIEHRDFVDMTESLIRTVEFGDFGDRVLSEHLLRVLGATVQVLGQHQVNDLARCSSCRATGPRFWRPGPCGVHDAFCRFLTGRSRLIV